MVLALLAVLIAPHFIDWSAYRADFEREAGRILGRPVAVRGTASVQILPFPSVTFTDVEVAGEADEPLLKVAKFRMDAELAPYLSGEIRIFSMRLDQPTLRLSIDPAGKLNLPIGGGTLPTNATVVLEDVTVTDGEVVIRDVPAETTLVLGSLDGTFAATSLRGPLTGSGTLLARGRPFDFQIATGMPNGEVRLPLKLGITDTSLSVSVSLDGRFGLKDGVPRFEGDVRSASLPRKPEPADTAQARDVPQPRLQGDVPNFLVTARGVAEPKLISLEDMRVSVGGGEKPYVLTGSARLAGGLVPDFELDLAGEQLDIDAIASGDAPRDRTSFAQRLEAARALFAKVPRPVVAGRARLSLPVVVAGDTTLRDLSIEASPLPAGWTVRRFAAELPGRTRIEASGVLDLASAPAFRGSLLLAARQPTGFSEWLTGSVDPAIRTLGQAGFSATVDLSAERQIFRDLEVNVGGDTLTGSLERTGTANARRLSADLRGARIDLDAFVALSRIFTGEADSVAEAREGQFKLVAGPVTFLRTAAERVDFDISFDGATLTIDHADIGGLAGSDLDAKGALTGFGSDLSGRIDLGLRSERPDTLFALIADRLPANFVLDGLRARAAALGPLKLAGVLHTTPGPPGGRPTLNADLKGNAAGSDVGLRLRLPNAAYVRGLVGDFGLDLSLRSDEAAGLLRQIGIEARPIPVPGPVSLDTSLSGDAAGTIDARIALAAPGSQLAAEGTVDAAAAGIRKAQFGISGRSDDLTPWLLTTGMGLGADPTAALPATFGGTLRYDGEVWSLSEVEGSLGPVDISADLERRGEEPVTGRLFLSELSLPWLASLAYGQPVVDPTKPDDWSGASFGRSSFPAIPLSLDLAMDQVELGGTAAVGDASARLETSGDAISLEDLRGTIGGGYGAATLSFRNANGTGAFSAEADLQGLNLGGIALGGFALPTEDDVASEAETPPISGTLDAKLRLDASGQSMEALVSAITGAGQIKLEDGSFVGIGTGMFSEILRRADAEGARTNRTAAEVAAILAGLDAKARYPLGSVASDFSIAGGVARFPAVRVAKPGETLTAEGAVDLSNLRVDASLRLDLDPGEDAVKGAAPAVSYRLSGPLSEPLLTPDVQALANYLSVRALEREQARVEAIQSALQEKLRLRREARFYRWLQTRQEQAAAEDIRSESARRTDALEADRQKRADEERLAAAAERARLERERLEAARERAEAARERARQERERAEPARRNANPPPGDLDLELEPPAALPPINAPTDLPGVRQPQPF